MNFTNEQMNKARSAKTADELLAMAKEAGIEMTEAQAAKYFAELNKQGELNDDELGTVAGGSKGNPHDDWEPGECSGWTTDYKCPICGEEMHKTGEVTLLENLYAVYKCDAGNVSFVKVPAGISSQEWYWSKTW